PFEDDFPQCSKGRSIETLIRKQATKLERVCPYVVSCQVSIEKPQAHQKSGNPFRVRVDVTVPPEHKLVTIRNAGEGELQQRLPTVVRRAFDATQRQLEKLVDKQRGDIKVHPAQEIAGLVVERGGDEGYGFINSLD